MKMKITISFTLLLFLINCVSAQFVKQTDWEKRSLKGQVKSYIEKRTSANRLMTYGMNVNELHFNIKGYYTYTTSRPSWSTTIRGLSYDRKYDSLNNQIELDMNFDNWYFKNEYDKNDKLVKITTYDSIQNVIAHNIYTYNTSGYLDELLYYRIDSLTHERTVYTYDSTNAITTNYFSFGKLYTTTKYTPNFSNNIVWQQS